MPDAVRQVLGQIASEVSRMENEKFFEILKAIPNIPKEKTGEYFYSECPCGGKITAIRSVNNGHLHARCDKCGFELHE